MKICQSVLFDFFVILIFLMGCSTVQKNGADETDVKKNTSPSGGFESFPFSERGRIPRGAEEEGTKDLDTLFKIANSFYDSGNHGEAEKIYRNILAIQPGYVNSAACHFNLGLIAMKENNWAESADRFRKASEIFVKTEDVRDSWLLLMESLRVKGGWDDVIIESDAFLRDEGLKDELDVEYEIEAGLRKAEALIMSGNDEEGERLAQYLLSQTRKGTQRGDLLYNPNYAYGNFIMGVMESRKFFDLPLEETEESLLKKCRIILAAQSGYLKSIQTGVIYWTNASAFEISRLYAALYQEMIAIPIPEDLNEEESKVYQCELWKKISGLLTRPRRYLKSSVDAAEKINEINQYTAKSFELLRKIEEVYEARERECEGF